MIKISTTVAILITLAGGASVAHAQDSNTVTKEGFAATRANIERANKERDEERRMINAQAAEIKALRAQLASNQAPPEPAELAPPAPAPESPVSLAPPVASGYQQGNYAPQAYPARGAAAPRVVRQVRQEHRPDGIAVHRCMYDGPGALTPGPDGFNANCAD
jgi:hypothetical protein